MCTITLSAILSENPDLTNAGTIFYNCIKEYLRSSEKVVVDMENVTALPSIFLNVSIGKIIEESGIEKLKRSVSFTKINKAQALRLQEYLQKFID